MPLPDIPSEDWTGYQADQFSTQANQRIDSMTFTAVADQRIASFTPPVRDNWAQPDTAPPSSDSLTNPLGTGNASLPDAAPEPSPPVPVPAPVAAPPSLPAPNAPATLDFGAAAPNAAPSPASPAASAPQSSSQASPDLVAEALNAADKYNLDHNLFLGLLTQESGVQQYDASGRVKTSPAGARGVGQLMPDTARGLGVNPDDPVQNMDGAAKYLRQNLDQFGGDVVKALAAYNAGAGNVQKYGGVPPFKETQAYVDNIMSNVARGAQDNSAQTGVPGSYTPGVDEGLRRVGSGLDKQQTDISQFGDPQLTADEAYAACGPATAVRFAERFGRNPTLKEALDLAKQTGWTSSGGMNGIANEKALMDKLGVPTKLVQGAQWDVFAREAQSGNPVTISTPGHYFFADGYNAETGAFHVGRSGLDLKNGSEWMTPAQMQSLMGTVNGGLLADNPAVPTPSTAQQDSNPTSWLAQQKDALTSGIGNAVSTATSTAQGWWDGLGSAASSVVAPPRGQPMTAAEQPTPSDSLTNPLGTGNAANGAPVGSTPAVGSIPPAPSGGPTVFDQAGQAVSDVYGALPQGSILKGGLNASNAAVPATDSSTSTMRPGGALVSQVESDFQRQRSADDAEVAQLGAKIANGTATPDEQQRFYQIGLNNAQAFGTNAPEAPASVIRMFHGTGGDFPRPDATRFDPNGLYGPGYYLTSDPRVASSYADPAIQEIANWSHIRDTEPAGSELWQKADQAIKDWTAQSEQFAARRSPNVRAVDVPQSLDLFNVEGDITGDQVRRIGDAIGGSAGKSFVDISTGGGPLSGPLGPAEDTYRWLLDAFTNGDKARANEILQRAGFDGISYNGGLRIPLSDSSGVPIAHTATVVFPDSLDKLRNAVSGTQGGQINPRFATTIGGAAAGGAAGNATTPDNASPQERLARIAGGALAGGAAGYGAARALTRLPVATGGEYQSVLPAETFTTSKAASPATGITDTLANVQRALTRAFTDRQVDVNQVQQAYQRALGRPLTADEMASELQRLNPHGAASVKVDEGLRPAIQSVGNDYNALRDYVTLRSNVQVADALGNDARAFSGGVTKADSQARIQQLQTQLGPDRFKAVQDAADQVSAFGNQMRQRLVDAEVLSPQQAADMTAKYPDWVKTRILDYMADPAGGLASGSKLGLASRDVHAYTQAGTARAREDPIASTIAYAHQVEAMANKNEAFNAMLKLDQASPAPQLRRVSQDFSPTKAQVTMVGFENGQKIKYVTDNKALGEAINGTSIMSVPQWTSAWQRVFRSLATSRNPVFLAGNAALDIPTYIFRTAIRDGGPQALPGIMADLAKGYGDAFRGVLQGEFRGPSTAAFLKGGGGQSGGYVRGVAEAAQSVADLRRTNVFQINGKADLLRLTKDVLTLKPVEGLGERIELGPRVAAYNRALKRGANPVQAVNEGRTVTVDFSQGGTVTKYLNNFIPFLNVGFQGPAQLARAFRDNPRGFVATAGTLIGLPSIAAETWNHADPQRWKDYQDVPDYVKNQGVVIMLPGQTSTDTQGNRKPAYAVIKLREWAPFAQIARAAVDTALGDNQRSWQEMAQSIASGFSPTNATSVSQIGSEPLAGVPILPAALQLQQNRDFFRSRDIVTNRNDQNASAMAQGLAPIIQSALDRSGMTGVEVRPSAIDFLIRDQGAGVGGAVLGAGDLVAGKPQRDQTAPSLPVVGGMIGRFSGSQTGQELQAARDMALTPSARRILRDNGIVNTPGPVGSTINQIPIKLDEEARYQQLANRYIDDAIHRAAASSEFARMTPEGKRSLMQGAIDGAKGKAGLEVLNTIPEAEKRRRLAAKTTGPSALVGAGVKP